MKTLENEIILYKTIALNSNGTFKKGTTYKTYIRRNYPLIYDKCILSGYFREQLYCLIHNIKQLPTCPVCNKVLPLRNFTKGLQKTCCKHCNDKLQSLTYNRDKLLPAIIRNNKKENSLQTYFKDINVRYDYRNKQIIFPNYCKHSPLYFKSSAETKLKRKYKNSNNLCIQCNREYVENNILLSDIVMENIQTEMEDFMKQYHNVISPEWFIEYYPIIYKAILQFTNHISDLTLIQRIWHFTNNIKDIPICNVPNCNCNAKWSYSEAKYFQHCDKHINYNFSSTQEKEISNFINSLSITHITNDRTLLNNNEIDIYIPELKVGIEYNGIFYHNYANVGSKKQYNKFIQCENKDIRLITIWEDLYVNDKLYYDELIKCLINYSNYKHISENIIIDKGKYNLTGYIGNKRIFHFICKEYKDKVLLYEIQCNLTYNYNEISNYISKLFHKQLYINVCTDELYFRDVTNIEIIKHYDNDCFFIKNTKRGRLYLQTDRYYKVYTSGRTLIKIKKD